MASEYASVAPEGKVLYLGDADAMHLTDRGTAMVFPAVGLRQEGTGCMLYLRALLYAALSPILSP